MKSTSALLVSLLGTASLFGCDNIIGSKPDPDQAGVAAELAPPPAMNAQQPAATPHRALPGEPAVNVDVNVPAANSDDEGVEKKQADDEDEDRADEDEPAAKEKRAAKDDDDEDRAPEKDLAADLSVTRLVMAKGVKSREPVGASNVFTAGEQDKIYAFLEVGNRDRVPSELYVTFKNHTTGKSARVPVQVGAGARWRTWVFTRAANKPGQWSATVKNAKGKTLASGKFSIEANKATKDESEAPAASKDAADDAVKKATDAGAAKKAAPTDDPPSAKKASSDEKAKPAEKAEKTPKGKSAKNAKKTKPAAKKASKAKPSAKKATPAAAEAQ
jgi:hypothetical protein